MHLWVWLCRKVRAGVRLTLVPQSLYAGAGLTSVSLLIWLWLLGNVLFGRRQNPLKNGMEDFSLT